jgi:hypothetical protein
MVLAACLLQANVETPVRVLSAIGERRADLPVAVAHPEPDPYLRVLTRGYAARLLRLYQLEQRFVRPGHKPQPGLLVITDTQGGFPRWGLYLDSPQPGLAYVDLHRRSVPSGRPAAIDQIFPHELLHIIVRDLAGAPPRGYATQVHAVGVKTDRITAFGEGFAEHAQVMAIDDADAAPDTRGIALDVGARNVAFQQFGAYRAALGARLRIAPKAQMTFPFWFSRAEQVLRYHAVKENLFAREPDVPRRLYSRRGAYAAYLLENTLPGRPDAAAKSATRLLATEGVVAALFHRLVTDESVQSAYRRDDFYARFGTRRDAVDPLDNAYLKVFAAIGEGGYDTAAVVDAYGRLFPDEQPALTRIVTDVLVGRRLDVPRELWVLNESARTGTSLFDQFRGRPRAPAFDLNAASRADLVAVPGIDLPLAERILGAAPFESIDDLRRVEHIAPEVVDRFRQMRRAMLAPPPPGTSSEGSLTFGAIVAPYAWRALAVWTICGAIGAGLYRRVRRVAWWRVSLNGLAAAAAALIAGWTIDQGTGLLALAAPVALLGLPGAVIRTARSGSIQDGLIVVGAWALAGAAAAVAVTPIGQG